MKAVGTSSKTKTSIQKKVKEKSFTIVAIGASTGGLEAFSALLKDLPINTGMAFIYVQHLSPDHKSLLTEILSKKTKMKVQEIDNMELMKPNNVYVIPHNKGIAVTDGHIKLLPHSKNIRAISIDILFASLAKTHKENVIGVILSGNAHDGTTGLKAIKHAGGLTFAQDDSAQAGSMPKSAIAAGVVDFILSPKKIALEIARLGKSGFKGNLTERKKKENTVEDSDPDLKTIFKILHEEKDIDFSHYKIATINRRVRHRMAQCNVQTIKAYGNLLLKKNKEADLLCKDLLINVTGFFRDTATFKHIKTVLLPKLLKEKKAGETLRIWVPACSTGQEAYSFAMLIAELQNNKIKKNSVKIFATDLSDQAIHNARIGKYSASEMESVPKKSMARFFTKTGDHYFIAKELREMCVFAPHNILSDPPFFRVDLISCRNLLIYFDSAAQKKALTTMHFALNDGGYLLLGKSETTGATSQLFSSINNKFKIYSRKKNTDIRTLPELTPRFHKINIQEKNTSLAAKKVAAVDSAELDNAIDAALLSRYMPACAIINKNMEILQFRGLTSLYLSHPSGGKANLNILKMMRPEFSFELRNAIHQAIKTKQYVRKSGIEIKIGSSPDNYRDQLMSLEVHPLKIEWDEPLLLIVFTLQEQVEKYIDHGNGKKNISTPAGTAQKDRRIKMLVEALNIARTEMDTVIESQETAYEELQTANEEIVSTNEELQTLNEELETSKEEIQATNEELSSTNHELQTHNDLLVESYDLSEAINATVHEPMLILDKNLRVKSANKLFYKNFLVKKEETEGMYLFELGNNQWNIPKLRKLLEDILLKNSHFVNLEITHVFPGIGEKTMLLNAHPIVQKAHSKKLILLAIADITTKKTKDEIVKASEIRYRKLIYGLPVAVYTCDSNGYVQLYNKAAVDLWGHEPVIGKDRWCGSWKIYNEDNTPLPLDTCPMALTLKQESIVVGKEIIIERKDGTRSNVIPNPQPVFDENGKLTGAINTLIDITARKNIEKELNKAKVIAERATRVAEEAQGKAEGATLVAEDAVKAKQQFLSNMSHEIRTPMNAIIGFTKVVLKTDLSSKQKEYLTAIKMSGDALIVLINDILDLAKVDAGKMTFEQVPFKMALSLSAMLHVFETKIQEKNLTLVKEYDNKIPDTLLGDPVRLHQIILNLVSNAVKFTNEGKITVRVSLLKEDERKATIKFEVSDTGIGIPQDKIENIFENFQQASSGTSRLYGGTGLGLAIVKQLVEPQGGTMTVTSKIGEGSTFSFTLNFQKTTAEALLETEVVELDTETKNIKVLVVEDIALNQLLMKTLLDDFGFERDIAANGKLAIEKLKKKAYDIILMDLQMPEMNGFEATEYIRQTLKSNIPIIALTADVTTVDLAKCKAVGMNDYLAKPVDERVLYRKIVGLVKKPVAILAGVKPNGHKENRSDISKKLKCVDLDYLMHRTKSDPKLMMEMIDLYLQQTPPLVSAMKKSTKDKDWNTLQAIVHKMIPSFSIMGIASNFETMAKKTQEYASTQQQTDEIPEMVQQLENICMQACQELEVEFNSIKNTQS